MACLKISLDRETFRRLLDSALRERRPLPWQAEVLLRQALGLPFPAPGDHVTSLDPDHQGAAHTNTEWRAIEQAVQPQEVPCASD
jgi:hypothetical protein